ncbi:hypothetical protein AB0395_39595 [Streptosporangium sp. NPDC051023]|uniref:hypothetical protein n=1 Tax=Streptosporangium sp. NPDC051023 TaxID=3155410 RepID=UPI00344FAAE2
MAIESWPRETREYLSVVVEGDSGLSALPVQMAVLAYGVRPTSGDWQTAEWDVDEMDGAVVAKVKIGPGTAFDFSAAPGPKVPWVKVTASEELSVLEGEPIRVT